MVGLARAITVLTEQESLIPPLDPLLNQLNPVHTFRPYFSKIYLFSHLSLVTPIDLFCPGSSTKFLMCSSTPTCSAHHTVLDLMATVTYYEE
jgi:hypothetical protein